MTVGDDDDDPSWTDWSSRNPIALGGCSWELEQRILAKKKIVRCW